MLRRLVAGQAAELRRARIHAAHIVVLTVRERKLHDHLPVDERKAHAGLHDTAGLHAAARERRIQRLIIRDIGAGARRADRGDIAKRHPVGSRKNVQVVDRQRCQRIAGEFLHLRADLPDEHRLSGADAHGGGIGLQRGIVLQHLRQNSGLKAAAALRILHGVGQPVAQLFISLAGLDRDEDRVRVRRDIAVVLQLGHDRIGRRLQRLVAQLQPVEHGLRIGIARAHGQNAAELVDGQLNARVHIQRCDAAGRLRGVKSAAEHDQQKHRRRGHPAPPRAAAAAALRQRGDRFRLRLFIRPDTGKDLVPRVRRHGCNVVAQLLQQLLFTLFLFSQDRHPPSTRAASPARGCSARSPSPAGCPAGRLPLCA